MMREIEKLLIELEGIKTKIMMEAKNWWWLDFGHEPIISVKRLERKEKGKGIEIFITPRESIITAIHDLIESLELLIKAKPGEVREEHYRAVRASAEELMKVLENIRDADRMISGFSALTRFAKVIQTPEGKQRVDELAKEAISWLIERFKRNPLEWEKEKPFFERMLTRLESMTFAREEGLERSKVTG